jgi:hypothetical protein
MYIILQDPAIILLAYCDTEYCMIILELLVLVQIGPSCPLAHSRLILSRLLLVELFIDTYIFFLRVLFARLL